MAALPDDLVDAIITDPPYGLSKEPNMAEVLRHWLAGDDYTHGGSGFMGKSWDSFVPGPATWREAFRVLKPGGHALVFAGSRTQDLMATSLRLAGFEIRDSMRYYMESDPLADFLNTLTPEQQQEFAHANAQEGGGAAWVYGSGFPKSLDVSKAVEKAEGLAAQQWAGYGTALKPAYEPIILARKPLGGTVAETVLKHGTGALNIDGCRVPTDDVTAPSGNVGFKNTHGKFTEETQSARPVTGRWPANILHDGLTEDWARFFYCAKTNKADRNAGCDHLEHQSAGEATGGRAEGSAGLDSPRSGAGRTSGAKNHHPTVKPTDLMRWCCRLVGHPGALILDPFSGSGSTGRGAILEGFSFMGFEMDPEYVEIANARIRDALKFHIDANGNI